MPSNGLQQTHLLLVKKIRHNCMSHEWGREGGGEDTPSCGAPALHQEVQLEPWQQSVPAWNISATTMPCAVRNAKHLPTSTESATCHAELFVQEDSTQFPVQTRGSKVVSCRRQRLTIAVQSHSMQKEEDEEY